jgi:hypothetical protein
MRFTKAPDTSRAAVASLRVGLAGITLLIVRHHTEVAGAIKAGVVVNFDAELPE